MFKKIPERRSVVGGAQGRLEAVNTAFVTLVALLQCCIGNLNRICKVILSYYLGYVNHKSKINM